MTEVFLIVLGIFGPAIVGEYVSEEACKAASLAVVDQLKKEEAAATKPRAYRMQCVVYPVNMDTMREHDDA